MNTRRAATWILQRTERKKGMTEMAIFRDDNGYMRNENGDYWSGTTCSWVQKEEWERLRRKAREAAMLTLAEWESEAAEKSCEEGTITFEIVAAHLNERHIAIKLACKMCGFEWAPIAELAILVVGGSSEVSRPVSLACPRCADNPDSEEAAA